MQHDDTSALVFMKTVLTQEERMGRGLEWLYLWRLRDPSPPFPLTATYLNSPSLSSFHLLFLLPQSHSQEEALLQ